MRTIFPILFCFVVFAIPSSAQFPVPAAKGKTIDVSLGFSYVSRPGGFSNRVGLNGADANVTSGYSRLGLKADLGYARASNFGGTGRHTDVLTYMVGPVFHPTMHRNFATYIHALGGPLGSAVLFPLWEVDSFSGVGQRTSPGWWAAELITR